MPSYSDVVSDITVLTGLLGWTALSAPFRWLPLGGAQLVVDVIVSTSAGIQSLLPTHRHSWSDVFCLL